MQTVNLDLSVKNVAPLLHAKQGEVGRKFKVILTDGGLPYAIPGGDVVSVWFSGASGEGNYTDIGTKSAISIFGNEITVEMITQMLARPGNGKLCLVINSEDGTQLGTWNIPYACEEQQGLDSPEAKEYYTAFSKTAADLAKTARIFNPDITLSKSGSPADAAETGRQISVERSRINNIIALPEGSTTGDAELLDVRVGSDGEIYESAGEAVRHQVSQLKSVQNEISKISLSGKFERGSLSTNGENIESESRIRTSSTISFRADTNIYIADGFRIYVFFFDASGVFLGNSGGWIPVKYCIPSGSRIKMVIAKIDETGVVSADINEFVSAITMDVPVIEHIDQIHNDLHEGFNTSINSVCNWERGSYNTTSGFYHTYIRIRQKYPVHLRRGAKIVVKPNGQKVAANAFRQVAQTGVLETDFEYIKPAFGYKSEEFTYISTEDVWLLLVVSKADQSLNIAPHELAVEIELYDTYAGRELVGANIDRLNYGKNRVKTVAHRGDVVDAPENTIAAYRKAVLNGYRYMETDVHFTADGIPVMLHDDTIDRTSNGTGNVADLTLEELKALDFGGWKSILYAGEKIPTFEEMLAFCRATGMCPFIELKDQTKEQVETLVGMVEGHGLIDGVHWISFSLACLGYVAEIYKNSNLCLISTNLTSEIGATMAQYKTGKNEVGILCYQNSTEEAAEICRENELYMMGGLVSAEAEVLEIPQYASWIISDGVDATKVLYKNAMGI